MQAASRKWLFLGVYTPHNLWFSLVVITTAQLHSTKPELRFCASSNPARGVSEIRDGQDLWQRLNAFRRSTIPQNNSSWSIYERGWGRVFVGVIKYFRHIMMGHEMFFKIVGGPQNIFLSSIIIIYFLS